MTEATSPVANPVTHPRGFWHTALRWTGHAIGILALFVAAVIGAVAIALAFGPLSLGPLAQPLIRAVSQSVAGYRLDASDALLEWSGEQSQLVVRFIDPHIVDRDGVEIASANDIAVSFSLQALIAGRIAPRSLSIVGPTATFMRLTDGSYDIGIRTETQAREKKVSTANADAGPFIKALLEPPVDGQEETYLSEIRLSNATITFIDQTTDSIVKAPRATLVVKRTATGLNATLDGQVSLPKGNWKFSGTATYDRGAPALVLETKLADANLGSLADAGPLFDGFDGADVPLDGDLTLAIDTKGAIVSSRIIVTARAGHVQMAAMSNIPIDVNSALIEAHYDGSQDLVTLDSLTVDSKSVSGTITGQYRLLRANGELKGWRAELSLKDGKLAIPQIFDGETPIDELAFKASDDLGTDTLTLDAFRLVTGKSSLDVTGRVAGLAAGKPAVKLSGALANVPMERLFTIWPKGVAEGARGWIAENVRGGAITKGQIDVDMTANQLAGAEPAPNSASRLQLDFAGLQMRYMSALPPLEDVSGSAVVEGNEFDGKVTAGHVGPVKMSEGDVVIHGLNGFGPPAYINARITGSARDVLDLINRPPLGYPAKFGLAPASVSGNTDIHLGITVPTRKDLKVDDIGFNVHAKLLNIAMPVVKDVSLTEGNADFAVTGEGLTAKGHGRVAGILADFAWTEDFNPGPGEHSTHLSATATVDEAMRNRIHIDPGSYLDGPVHGTMSMVGDGFRPVTGSAEVDLNDASVAIPELGYTKAAGQPAKLTASLAREPGGYRAYPVKLEGKGIDAQLDIHIGADGTLKSIKADRLVAGRNDVSFNVDLEGKNIVEANVKTIDLDTLIEALRKRSERDEKAQGAAAPASTPDAADTTNFTMRIKADRVLLRGGAEAKDLRFDVDMDRGYLMNLYLYGAIGTGHVSSQLYNITDGTRRVIFKSDDMGAFIAGVTGFQSLSDGYGKLDLLFPKIGAGGDPSGSFAMNDFRLHDQPFLTRLLASGSFTGLLDLLRGGGIRFNKVVAGIRLHGPQIIVRDLMMSGPSVGASGEGYVDRESNQLHARGTLAPIYSLNSILADIPAIGEILGGDQGILAMAFAIDGTVDDLDLSVSPLSILAPGFLRHLFEFDSPLDKDTGEVKPPS